MRPVFLRETCTIKPCTITTQAFTIVLQSHHEIIAALSSLHAILSLIGFNLCLYFLSCEMFSHLLEVIFKSSRYSASYSSILFGHSWNDPRVIGMGVFLPLFHKLRTEVQFGPKPERFIELAVLSFVVDQL